MGYELFPHNFSPTHSPPKLCGGKVSEGRSIHWSGYSYNQQSETLWWSMAFVGAWSRDSSSSRVCTADLFLTWSKFGSWSCSRVNTADQQRLKQFISESARREATVPVFTSVDKGVIRLGAVRRHLGAITSALLRLDLLYLFCVNKSKADVLSRCIRPTGL